MEMIKKEQVFTGIIAALLTCFSSIVIIDAADDLQLSELQLFSWISSIYIIGGLVSLILTIVYKMPLIGAHSLATAIYLIPIMSGYTVYEMAGGYLVAGIILLLVSQLRILRNLIYEIPNYIIEAMLAGIVINYILNSLFDLSAYILVLILSITAYFFVQKYIRRIPGFFGGLVTVAVFAVFIGFEPLEINRVMFAIEFIKPEIDLITITVISIPVAVMILSNEASISLSALKKNDYEVPFQQVVLSSGIGTSIVSMFGGHAAGIGGMSTTICSSEEAGNKSERYKGAFIAGVLILAFGVFAPLMISLISSIPTQLVSIIVILSLTGILLNCYKSLRDLKSSKQIIIMLIAFIISVVNVNIYFLSAPLLSLIIGSALHIIFSKND